MHIFEPRYRLMMRHCIDQQQPFGVVLIQHGLEALGPLAEPHRVGCSARIAGVEALPDGRMNLTALGEDRFRISNLNYEQTYLTGEVESLPLERPHSIEIMRGVRRLGPWVAHYLKLVHLANPADELDLAEFRLPEDPLALLNLAAALLQVPAVEKQPLLEALYASQMLEMLERLYRRETALLRGSRQHNQPAPEHGAWLN